MKEMSYKRGSLIGSLKKEIRRKALRLREQQTEKDQLSEKILKTFVDLPSFATARTVLVYLHHKSEVRTTAAVENMLRSDQRIIVPFVDGGQLELFHLEDFDELEPGAFEILEPAQDLRRLPGKQVSVGELDLVMVPGVAFDKRGGRLGYGKGYYDKFLAQTRLETELVGLAFEVQVFPEIPMGQSDMFVDKLITETGIYST
jgi:5-formyltetrahydrofolate cyclo-ligase